MKLPRLKFTMGNLMVAVAIVGSVLGGLVLKGRADRYRVEAERCETQVLACGLLCYFDSPRLSREENERRSKAHWDWVARRRVHYQGLKARYEHAAGHPWLPVTPDPPDPPEPE